MAFTLMAKSEHLNDQAKIIASASKKFPARFKVEQIFKEIVKCIKQSYCKS